MWNTLKFVENILENVDQKASETLKGKKSSERKFLISNTNFFFSLSLFLYLFISLIITIIQKKNSF